MPTNLHVLLFSPLGPTSAAYVCMSVGLVTRAWEAYQEKHPCEDLYMRENVQHMSYSLWLPYSL